MSATRINNKKQSTSSIKPFCKVCHDAGKTEKEYTSHFVRASPEPNAPVVCPTLLAQPCRFCQQGGHTPAYCPELAKRKKAEEKAIKMKAYQDKKQQEEQQQQSKPATKSTKMANAFAVFDSDSEEEKPKKKQEEVFVIKKKQPVIPTASIQLKSEEFPALSISKSEQQSSKPSAKQSAPKPASFLTALQQSHPSLKVPSKMTDDVFSNATIVNNTIVLNKKQMEQREQEAVEEEEEQISVPSEVEMSGFYDTALETFKKQMEGRPKASQMDWAQQEEDSDDEDW